MADPTQRQLPSGPAPLPSVRPARSIPAVGVRIGVAVLACLALALVLLNLEPIGEQVGPSCSLTISASGVSLSARGWTAPRLCGLVEQVLPPALHGAVGPTIASGAEVCATELDGSRLEVREAQRRPLVSGALCDLMGNLPVNTPGMPSGPQRGLLLFLSWVAMARR